MSRQKTDFALFDHLTQKENGQWPFSFAYGLGFQNLLQQLQHTLGDLVRLGLVVTSSVSLASPQAVKLAHFAAPPLPTEPASLGFGGDPGQAAMLSQAG